MTYTKEQIEAGLNKFVSKDDTKNELTEKGFEKIQEAIQSGDRIERKEWYLEYPITSTIIVNIFMFLLYLVTEKTIFVNVASTLTIMLPLFMLIDAQVLVNRFMIGKLFLPHNKNINEILSIYGINRREKNTIEKVAPIFLIVNYILLIITAKWYISIIAIALLILFTKVIGYAFNESVKAMLKIVNK